MSDASVKAAEPRETESHAAESDMGESVEVDDALTSDSALPHQQILDAAIASIGGVAREGQRVMADAVAQTLHDQSVLLVQAGTGTGKSLGYLVPALAHAQSSGEAVVVATATLALQNQLATKDAPTVADAVEKITGKRPKIAVVKGRSNYACLMRVHDASAADQDTLIGGVEVLEATKAKTADAETVLGAEVVALREWAKEQERTHGLADRDDAPNHSARAWAQVSVNSRQCLGSKCEMYTTCFAEESRTRGKAADLVITNHALLAIDAMGDQPILPNHDAVIIDEAHELPARVTSAASEELSVQQIERLSRAASAWITEDLAVELLDVADGLSGAMESTEPGRLTNPDGACVMALARVRDVARKTVSALASTKSGADAERARVQGDAREVHETAQRMADLADADVVWLSDRERFGAQLNVAPLSVAGLLRHRVLAQCATVLTSATLSLGGSFTSMAGQLGMRRDEENAEIVPINSRPSADEDDKENAVKADRPLSWRGLDVGSPFDYVKQGILYIASDLQKPGRDGLADDVLAQIAQLIWAAEGRTLGLFSSQRNAEAAARYVRTELPKQTILCQGEGQLPELTRQFAAEPETCLFGTVSLWQGIDVPGETCRLVIIDRIPFPRPDDPVTQARQESVARAGGNGFMQVAAAHAGLLLAQGAGRLIRRSGDRGVVAILDPRIATARYGSFLRACLPPFWQTKSIDTAVEALRRLHGKI